MGANVKYGSISAGAYMSHQPGTLQAAFVEGRAEPKWNWQSRSPKTWKDKYRWNSSWSWGCVVGAGDFSGYAVIGIAKDLYEPYSCDGEGTQSKNFLRGTCKDSGGTAVANAEVQAFVTATDTYAGSVFSLDDGTYVLGVEQSKATPHYLVAYKVNSPDIAGTTVNTLLPTNVDGTA